MNAEKLISLHAEAWKRLREVKTSSLPPKQTGVPADAKSEKDIPIRDVWAWIVKNLG